MGIGNRCRNALLYLLTAAALGPGGCLWLAPPVHELETQPAPGSYYVEEHDGHLYYYELPAFRGAAGRWVELEDGGTWFAGPGWYRFSDDYVWSPDESAADLTLDDLIQLHDPPPVPD